MNWQPGRQNSNYYKLTIFSFWRIDCHLVKIPTGSSVPYHTDPVPGKRHYRLNIDLIKPTIGGKFMGKTILKLPRITLIRPDLHQHSITEIFEGKALILSIGLVI